MTRRAQNQWRTARHRLAALVTLSVVASALNFVPSVAPVSPAAAAVAANEITITPTGFEPADVIVEPGTTVLWRNDTVAPNSVTSTDGLVDSGPIPPGGGFTVAFPGPGWVDIVDAYGNPGSVTVGSTALDGAPAALAVSVIPDTRFPPFTPEEVGTHPETALILSRRRLIVGVSRTATVAEVNAALTAAGTPLIGGIADDGFLLVANPDDDFASLDAASDALETSPAIRYAIPDGPYETTALPVDPLSGFDLVLPASPDGWDWNSSPDTAGLGFEFEGNGANWALENVRAPQVWNLREAIEDHGADIVGGVVDSDIGDGHPELPLLEQASHCTSLLLQINCATDGDGSHGTHVSGIVSSTWGNPAGFASAGRPSLDNGTRVIGLPFGGIETIGGIGSAYSVVDLQSRMVSLAEAGEPIRVVNQSAGAGLDVSWWARTRRTKTCGPLPAGDDANGTLPCVPSNDDAFMAYIADLSQGFRDVVERGADQDILYTVSASNNAQPWCWDQPNSQLFRTNRDTRTHANGGPLIPDPTPPTGCSSATVPINASMAGGGLKYLGVNWTGPDPNPILVVESIGTPFANFTDNFESFNRSSFSQIGGHVSAPGATIYSSCRDTDLDQGPQPDPDSFHCTMSGTSMAAPLVASLALTLSRHSSEPITELVRDAITNWAVPNPAGGAAPHIDAFSSLLSLPGAARELVDVNDYSPDGNRRVFRDGSFDDSFDGFADEAYTDRDDEIDLRDFRRFRDAWLQICDSGGADPECPAIVLLDGPDDHVKRDLNLDGCVPSGAATCRNDESVYPRFDFNGDGRVTRYDPMLMPFDEDGFLLEVRPASINDHPALTDLEVLRSQFDPADPGDWTRDDLDALMTSGDITVDAQSLFDFGATSVDINVVLPQFLDGSGNSRELDYTIIPDPFVSEKVVTVPADQPVELVIMATFPAPAGAVVVVDQTLDLVSGQDHFVNACGIDVDVAPPVVAPDTLADLTATISGCGPGGIVDGIEVALTLTPTDTNGAALTDDAPLTDAAGVATTTIETGTILGGYTIAASAIVVDSQGSQVTIEGETTFRVDAAYEMEVIDLTRAGGPVGFGIGPGIGADGTVGYLVIDDTGTEVWYDEGLGRLPVPDTRIGDDTDPDVEQGWFGKISVTDDGSVWALNERVEPATVGTGGFQRQREIIRQPVPTGTQDRISMSHLNLLGPIDPEADYEVIALPSPNDSGGVVFPVREFDASGPLYRLATPVSPDDFVGPAIATVPLDADLANQPAHGDNEATVLNALLSAGDPVAAAEAIVIGPGVLGIDDSFDGFVLAVDPINDAAMAVDEDGVPLDPDAPAYFFTTPVFDDLGQQVAMSQDGRVIAFLGDRGEGWGLFVYLRPDPTSAAFEGPILVIGENAVNPVLFDSWKTDTRIGVQLNEAGPGGLDGDHVILSYLATPSAGGDGFTDQPGLFTSEVELESTAGGTVLHPRQPVAAIQINDRVDATRRVTDIGIWDSIDNGPTPNPGDHRLVWWQILDDGEQQIIRATKITTVAAALVGERMPGLSRRAPSRRMPARIAPAAGVTGGFGQLAQILPPPDRPTDPGMTVAIPAMVIGDLTPTAGELVRITNRSRDSAGTALGANLTTSLGGSPITLFSNGSRDIVPVAAGPFTVTMTVDDGTSALATSVELTIEPAPNNPPIPVLDGPWVVGDGGRVVLDGSASSDPDAGDSIVAYEWDFDGNVDFAEFSGPIVDLSVAEFDALACVTECERNEIRLVRLRVTDSNGTFEIGGGHLTLSSDTADFTLQIDPAAQFMNPGARTDLLVKVNSLGGFVDPVDLTVEALPAGWSASINPETVTPNGTALLSVFPDSAAPEGDVPIQVTGTSGDLARTTGSTASVTFALIPLCYATVSGRVTDIDTGQPLSAAADRIDVSVEDDRGFWSATVDPDADGRYSIAEVPVTTRLLVQARGYSTGEHWSSALVLRQTVCDANVEIDFELERREYGTIVGRIVEAIADPTDPTPSRDLYPSDIPVEGIRARTVVYEDTSGSDGTFRIENIPLNSRNAPRNLSIFGGQDGYWGTSKDVTIREGAVIDVGDLPILPRCSSTISATGQVFDTNGDPAQTWVRFEYEQNVQTAADGTFSLGPTVRPLGQNNSAIDVRLIAQGLFYLGFGDSAEIHVPACDLDVTEHHEFVVEAEPPPPPPDNYAIVEGRVLNERTGEPIPNADVFLRRGFASAGSDRADAEGRYLIDDVFVGVGDDTTEGNFTIEAGQFGYWGGKTPVFSLDSTSPTTIDVEIEPIDHATVTGIVVDSATQEPIERARVAVSGIVGIGSAVASTGPDGRFEITELNPAEGNVPAVVVGSAAKSSASVGTPGLWYQTGFDVVLQPGGTTDVRIELLQVCTDVSIHGLVINAETLLPLEDVRVTVPGVTTFTGSDGTFLLEEVELDEGNEPATVTVSASKAGFITLRKDVTVFCGANVRVDFGAPSLGTGTITGTVTDVDTGLPIEGAFIGSEFGGRDTTDVDGRYLLPDVPLAFDGSPRDWKVDVVGPRGAAADAIVTVEADTETVQDFQLSVPVNRAPTALGQSVETDQEIAVGILLAGTDPESDPLTFAVVDQPASGSLTGTGAAWIYTPNSGATSDSFTFTVFDGELTSEPATVDIVVLPPNDVPIAHPQEVTVDEDSSVAITLTGSDPEGSPLTYAIVEQPSDGSLTGTEPDVVYEPGPDYNGPDEFRFVVDDGRDPSAPAAVSITVVPVPDPPVAAEDTDTTDEGVAVTTDVALNDSDVDGDLDPTTVRITTDPAGGTAVPNGDGTVTYTPASGFFGNDPYTYEICDASGLCDSAVVDVTVEGPPPPDLVVELFDQPDPVPPGGTVVYRIFYSNLGGDATGVTLAAVMPDGGSFDEEASSPGWECSVDEFGGALCTLEVGDLAAGEEASVDLAVAVDDPVPTGVQQLTVVASIEDDGTAGPDENPTDNVDEESTSIEAALDLWVTKTDNGPSAPGATIVYRIEVGNDGDRDVDEVVVFEEVPEYTTFNPGASSPGWECLGTAAGSPCILFVERLAPGGSSTVDLVVVVDDTVPAGVTEILNTAEVEGFPGSDSNPTNNVASVVTPLGAEPPAAAPDLAITKVDDGAAEAGGSVVYSLSFVNNGDQDATGVVVIEAVPQHTTFDAEASTAGWDCAGTAADSICALTVGDLTVGNSGVIEFAVVVDETVPAGLTELSNTAGVADDGANGADPNPDDNVASLLTPLDVAPDLAITKVDDGAAEAGGSVVYSLSFVNNGDQDATGVVVIEAVPQHTTFDAGASTAGWDCADIFAGRMCELAVGALAAGESGAAEFSVVIDDAVPSGVTELSNTAVIADDGGVGADPNPSDNVATRTTEVAAAPDMWVTKTDDGPATPGSTITYRIEVGNDGDQDATGVLVIEAVPQHTTFDAGASTAGWDCAGTAADSICVLTVGDLTVGNSGVIEFAVVVDETVPAGLTELSNTAGVADDGANGADPNPDDNVASLLTALDAAPDLAVTKADDGDSQPGGTITYTLAYANVGNQDATGAVLQEVVPFSTVFDPAGSTAGWSCEPDSAEGSACQFEIGPLTGGDSGEAVFAVTVADVLGDGVTAVSNLVEIRDDGANGIDPNTGNNMAAVLTSVNLPPVADAGGPYLVIEGDAIALDGSESSDPEGNELLYEWDLDGDGEFDDATGPAPSFGPADGPAEVTVEIRVTDPVGLVDTDTAVVTVVNRPPEVTASVPSQTVQYSDAIAAVTLIARDVLADTPDHVSADFSRDGGAFAPGLPAGLALRPDGCVALASTVCGWTLYGAADTPPGVYTIRVEVADEDGGADSADVGVTVVAEDAVVGFDPANVAVLAVTALEGVTGPFSLSFDVSEVDVPDEVTGDANLAGDIETALVEVSLVPAGPGSTVSPVGPCAITTTPGLVDPDSTHTYDVLSVECDFDQVAVNSYVVAVEVGGNYIADGEGFLTVSDPGVGKTTGGGWFDWPGTDDKTNFGFTAGFRGQGLNLWGSFLLTRHLPDGTDYQVKSTSLDRLAIGETDDMGWAIFSGEATYREPGSEKAVRGYTFVVYVEDYGEPGVGVDRIWIEVRDEDGALTPIALPASFAATAEVIDGGNIVAPHTNDATNSPP